MMKQRTFLFKGVLVSCCLILLAVGLIGGCVSHELPAPLTAEEQAKVQHTHFDFTVGLERPARPDLWTAEAPLMALQGTRLFKVVDYLDRLPSPPDLIARGDTIINGTPTVPILTIVTLGIFPSKMQEGWGYTFSFHAPNAGGRPIEISVAHKGTSLLGWMGGFLNMSPDWQAEVPIKSQRLYDRLALELIAKSEDIRRSGAR